MTGTGDMELLEREPSLALLAKLGAQNRNAAAVQAARQTFFNERGSCHAVVAAPPPR
jgi:hypothetical protein